MARTFLLVCVTVAVLLISSQWPVAQEQKTNQTRADRYFRTKEKTG